MALCVQNASTPAMAEALEPLLATLESAQLRLLALVERTPARVNKLEWCVFLRVFFGLVAIARRPRTIVLTFFLEGSMLGATFVMSLSSFPESPGSRPPPYLLPIPPLLLQPLSPPLLQPSTTAARSCLLSCHLLLSLTRLVSGPNRLTLEDALGVLTKAGLHHAIGLLYMARDMVREALSVWRDLGTGVKVDACSDGLISTLNFLSTCEDMVRLAALCPCV